MKHDRSTLLEILGFSRPHDSVCEKRFCQEFVDKAHPDMTRDAFGNRILRLGTAPVMWSCHVDTVAAKGGPQRVGYNADTGIAYLVHGQSGQSLGADNGAGLWIMLAMIERGVEGLYVFHRGEEKGCLGSRWIVGNTPGLVKGIDAAIAFDRCGTRDIITHQSYGMTASDGFAWSLARQLNRLGEFGFRPDNTGIYTDTNEYADLIAECTNVSVGYEGNHGPSETLDVAHCEALLEAVCDLDLDALQIDRQPGEGGWAGATFGRAAASPFDRMCEAVLENFEAAAELLLSYGVDSDALVDFAYMADDAAFTSEEERHYDTVG